MRRERSRRPPGGCPHIRHRQAQIALNSAVPSVFVLQTVTKKIGANILKCLRMASGGPIVKDPREAMENISRKSTPGYSSSRDSCPTFGCETRKLGTFLSYIIAVKHTRKRPLHTNDIVGNSHVLSSRHRTEAQKSTPFLEVTRSNFSRTHYGSFKTFQCQRFPYFPIFSPVSRGSKCFAHMGPRKTVQSHDVNRHRPSNFFP